MLARLSALTWPQVVLVMVLASMVAFLGGVFVLFQLAGCFMPTLEECPPGLAEQYPPLMWIAVALLCAGTVVFFATPVLRAVLGLRQR